MLRKKTEIGEELKKQSEFAGQSPVERKLCKESSGNLHRHLLQSWLNTKLQEHSPINPAWKQPPPAFELSGNSGGWTQLGEVRILIRKGGVNSRKTFNWDPREIILQEEDKLALMGNYVFQESFGKSGHSLRLLRPGGCYWHVVHRGLGCCYACYNKRKSP